MAFWTSFIPKHRGGNGLLVSGAVTSGLLSRSARGYYPGIMSQRSVHRVLRAIAIFKLVKAGALLLVAAAAFEVAGTGALTDIAARLRAMPLAEGQHALLAAISVLIDLTPREVELVGTIACCYALLFAVEGYGLWRQQRWAEYLIVIATASLIPFEAWAFFEKATVLRGAALLVNIAIVICVMVLLRRKSESRTRFPNGVGL